MPRLKPETAKFKAGKLIKAYQDAGFNQRELARREGVSQSAIAQRLNKPFVKKTMAELMDEAGLDDVYLAKKIKDGLGSKDLNIRYKYLMSALKVKGHLDYDAKKDVRTIINVEYGHRRKIAPEIPQTTTQNNS